MSEPTIRRERAKAATKKEIKDAAHDLKRATKSLDVTISGLKRDLGRSSTQPTTRRERARAATMTEIKDAALDLMRASKSLDVTFADIARELGLSAPALYRYYSDRDELLTALIVDAYNDLADLVTGSLAAQADAPERVRLATLMNAYRSWAVTDPVVCGLIFGMPVAGYATPESAGTITSAGRAMAALESIPLSALQAGSLGPAARELVGASLAAMLPTAKTPHGSTLPAANHQATILVWTSVHGFASLEAFGHMDWLSEAARDDLFDACIDVAALTLGLP